MKLSFGRRFLACSPLVVVVLAGASSHRALADSDPAEGHPVATPQVQTLVIHARPSPNLILRGGREVKYVGLFSADANFHGSSKLNRFLDNATKTPVPDTSLAKTRCPPWLCTATFGSRKTMTRRHTPSRYRKSTRWLAGRSTLSPRRYTGIGWCSERRNV